MLPIQARVGWTKEWWESEINTDVSQNIIYILNSCNSYVCIMWNFHKYIIFQKLQTGYNFIILEMVHHIPQSSSITIRLFSVISRTLVGESYPSAQMQSVYFTAPADWAKYIFSFLEAVITFTKRQQNSKQQCVILNPSFQEKISWWYSYLL